MLRKEWDTEVYDLKRAQSRELEQKNMIGGNLSLYVVFRKNVMIKLDNVKLNCCR